MNPEQLSYFNALLQNDERTLNLLYKETIPAITAYIVQNSGTEADAQDIFQEALLAIFQKARSGQLQLTTGFQPYLYAVCRNLWLMQLRKKKVRRVTNLDAAQHEPVTDSFGDAEHTADQYARLQLLHTQLEKLGEGCRELLRLCFSGKPLDEVARLLNNSYAYIRKKKSECKGKLFALVKSRPEFAYLKW
jgi:RNA polymerase sigma factor (sigma-70 family)